MPSACPGVYIEEDKTLALGVWKAPANVARSGAEQRVKIVEEKNKYTRPEPIAVTDDDPATQKTRVAIDAYLHNRWRLGVLMGNKPEETYFARVGKNITMTAAEINAGELIVEQEPAAPQPIELPTAVPLFIGYTEKDASPAVCEVGTFDNYVERFGGPPPPPPPSALSPSPSLNTQCALYNTVRHYFDNGGGRCYILPVGTYESIKDAEAASVAATFGQLDFATVLAQAPEATLLAFPDLVLLSSDETRWIAAWKKMLTAYRYQRGMFALLDTPADPALARKCLEEIANEEPDALAHGAAYWPHLITDYPGVAQKPGVNQENWITVPPSGALAAVFQRTDRERGIWKAPANVPLVHVIQPARDYRQADILFQKDGASINLIRSFPGRGVRVWGCRTLSPQASPWRYVQVRRTLSYIEASLTELGRFVVFEPNNAITWFKFKARTYAWLHQLWLTGGLAGVREDDAFQLQLGVGESMTQDDVLAGRLILKVLLAAYYPAEFIELCLQFQTAEGHSALLTLEAAPSHKSILL
ncbi:hypothetical protein DFQ28_005936 [Apophysomyces sp. BC1034]|nr:hypothetical protein DFQ28_005936 [Apophysomyces sp. BC1034]